MKISIFGLGYVGAVSLACLARDGHVLTGVDIDRAKLELIRSGNSPIIEAGIVDLMKEVVESGRVTASDNAKDAILNTEISFVCVGTPSQPNGNQSLDALVRLSKQIGEALDSKDEHHTIVIRSTVQPGTVESRVIPILESKSGKKCGTDFHVCFQPEFLREGSSIKDYDHPPMTVVGCSHKEAGDKLRELFGHLPCQYISTDIRTAETLKYACNAFHAVKVSFANEIGRIAQALGTDSREVMELLCIDKQLNISSAYLRPGFAFGGSCLPKDLKALLYLAKTHDVEAPMLEGLLPSNRIHVEHAVELILRQKSRNVGIIGLSFKSGTDDLRDSPMVDLVERLIGKGLTIKIYDPEVRISQLLGANKKYIEDVIPHIGSLMFDTIQEVLDRSHTIVVGLHGRQITDELLEHCVEEQYFLDLVGMPDVSSLRATYQGLCW